MQPQGPYTPQPLPQYTPAPPPQPQLPSHVPPGYEFIHNATPPKQPRGPQTTLGRVLVIGGGLIALLIVFSFAKSILSGGGNGPAMLAVAQDQQELVHIAANAQQQQVLSVSNRYFASTANLGLTSDQSTTLSYMKKNKIKAKPKQLMLKVSAQTDSQLKAAAAASTYDRVFKDTMHQKIAAYQRDLQIAHNKTAGKKGKKLLADNYDHSVLLVQQLDTRITQ